MAPDEIQQLLTAGRWSYGRWREPRQSGHLVPGKYAASQRVLLPLGGHLVQQAAPGSRPPAAPIWVGRRDEQYGSTMLGLLLSARNSSSRRSSAR